MRTGTKDGLAPSVAQTVARALQDAFDKVGSPCPECGQQAGQGQAHGVSQAHPGEPCRLGALLATEGRR